MQKLWANNVCQSIFQRTGMIVGREWRTPVIESRNAAWFSSSLRYPSVSLHIFSPLTFFLDSFLMSALYL